MYIDIWNAKYSYIDLYIFQMYNAISNKININYLTFINFTIIEMFLYTKIHDETILLVLVIHY